MDPLDLSIAKWMRSVLRSEMHDVRMSARIQAILPEADIICRVIDSQYFVPINLVIPDGELEALAGRELVPITRPAGVGQST
jgi:hypothetical protein